MTLKSRTVVITLSAIAGLSCYAIIIWDASAMSNVISWVKKDRSQNEADEGRRKGQSETRKIEADEIEKKPMLELSREELAELEEAKEKNVEAVIAVLGEARDAEKLRGLVEASKIDGATELAEQQLAATLEELEASAKRKVEEVIATFDKRGETQSADSLRRLLAEGNVLGALQVGNEQLRAWDPWSRSALSAEARDEMLFKATIFGVSFEAVVAYEMARARVPTSRILETMKTYDSLDETLLRQIDYISKHVDDQHLHYRLWKLSSAIDGMLSEKVSRR